MSNRNLQKLVEKREQQLKLLVYSDEFQKDIKSLRKSHSIPPTGYLRIKLGLKKLKVIDVNIDIQKILTKFDLPPSWYEAIRYFLVLNNVNLMPTMLGITIQKDIPADGSIPRELSIKIDRFTTLQDLEDMWPLVKIHQQGLSYSELKKQLPSQNLDLYILAKQLRSEGKNTKEIANILSAETGKNISYDDVNTYIHRFNQQSARYYDTKRG